MAELKNYIFISSIFLSNFVLIVLTAEASNSQAPKPYPIILVPGDGGSQFESRLDKPSSVHIWCQKKTDYWFSLWLNIELLAPYVLDCTVDNIRLVYDNVTRTTSNSPGVQIRVPGFGNTSSVEWLDPTQFSPTSYFNPIVNALVALGYERDVNVRGAPYDFRKAPNENQEYLHSLRKLIEETYAVNGNTPVVMLAHSMGNMYTYYLLQSQPQAWKTKYVRAFISMAGPFGGVAKLLRLMASGDDLGVWVVNPLTARPEQRSMPSSAWMMPYESFWAHDETLVYTPHYNYSTKDYAKFFKDINYPDGLLMRQDTEQLTAKLTPPGVEVFCMHGVNVSTPEKFVYNEKTWYSQQPEVVNGDGDGTVNRRSAEGCMRWQGKQKQTVTHKVFPSVDHMAILADKDVLAYISEILSSIHEQDNRAMPRKQSEEKLSGNSEGITNKEKHMKVPEMERKKAEHTRL